MMFLHELTLFNMHLDIIFILILCHQVKTGGMVVDKLGRGKQSIAIDLKHPVGKSIIRRLTSNADILLDPFRPGQFHALVF